MFTRDCRSLQFLKPAQFTSTGRTYTTVTITVGYDVEGSGTATEADPSTFPG